MTKMYLNAMSLMSISKDMNKTEPFMSDMLLSIAKELNVKLNFLIQQSDKKAESTPPESSCDSDCDCGQRITKTNTETILNSIEENKVTETERTSERLPPNFDSDACSSYCDCHGQSDDQLDNSSNPPADDLEIDSKIKSIVDEIKNELKL